MVIQLGSSLSAYVRDQLRARGWGAEDLAFEARMKGKNLRVSTVRSVIYGARENPTLETLEGLAAGFGFDSMQAFWAEVEKENGGIIRSYPELVLAGAFPG